MSKYVAWDQLLKRFYFPWNVELSHDQIDLITQSLNIS